MSAGVYNIEIDQGSDFEVNLAVSGTNLDGFSARGQIRPTGISATLLGEFTFEITNASTTGGDIKMELPGFISKDIPAGVHVYDVEISNTTTRKTVRLIQGEIKVIQGVTR